MLVDADSGIFSHQQPLETGLHTMHADEYDGAQENIGTDLWNTQLDIGSSPLSAGEDFDLDAMNLTILLYFRLRLSPFMQWKAHLGRVQWIN